MYLYIYTCIYRYVNEQIDRTLQCRLARASASDSDGMRGWSVNPAPQALQLTRNPDILRSTPQTWKMKRKPAFMPFWPS